MPRHASRDPPSKRVSRLPPELLLDDDRLLASPIAAEFLGLTASALEGRRRLNQAPHPAVTSGNRALYRLGELRAYARGERAEPVTAD